MKIILPVVAALLITTVACNNNQNQQSIKALNNSLERVNSLAQENISLMLSTLQERQKDPQTKARADIWAPKAYAIRDKAKELVQYIDGIKKQVKDLPEDNISGAERLLNKEGSGLYKKLQVLGDDIIEILAKQSYADNSTYQERLNRETKEFKNRISLRLKTMKDSTSVAPIAASSWVERNFSNATPVLALAMLSKVQNDVLVTENELLEYCNTNSEAIRDNYETFKPLVTMNRSYVKSGQSIEVYAGVAAFSASAVPRITIDGKPVKVDDDGVATWNFNANKKAGKYTVPVTIEYFMPDGTRQTIGNNLKYTVVE